MTQHINNIIITTLRDYDPIRIGIFGSYARNEQTKNSDIDIFILVQNLKMKKKVEPFVESLSNKCFDLYGNRFAPYILTGHEIKQRRNLSVIQEINQGIQLFPKS